MEKTKKHIIIVAGETSGDIHAAHLVDKIKEINPKITFSGLGGPLMHASGVEIYEDLTRLAVIGFLEVLKHYWDFKRLFHLILDKIKETQADAVLLVDYPGFNLRLARSAKRLGIKVFYYISPQLWAWKEDRIKIVRNNVDRMIVFFEFEKTFYKKHGVEVDFVGHPLIDDVQVMIPARQMRKRLGLSENQLTIGLLPGSREKEVRTLFPIMLATAAQLYKNYPRIQFLVLKAPPIPDSIITHFLKMSKVPVHIAPQTSYDAINACHLCLVASGTATLETAILKKPMVVIYKTSFLTWLLAKSLMKIPFISLVNIVAGTKIVPECVQYNATANKISTALSDIFKDELKLSDMKSNLERVKFSLGKNGASLRAAEAILKHLG